MLMKGKLSFKTQFSLALLKTFVKPTNWTGNTPLSNLLLNIFFFFSKAVKCEEEINQQSQELTVLRQNFASETEKVRGYQIWLSYLN